ncbi:uncharacterized protein VNE69_08171 [Vairimorpha necatrix]|uniref:Uncharacterized protein n=1 Tax=Vairimorpha necatrix TaxID=6039 RepID=A0AAX4JF64_9MICR
MFAQVILVYCSDSINKASFESKNLQNLVGPVLIAESEPIYNENYNSDLQFPIKVETPFIVYNDHSVLLENSFEGEQKNLMPLLLNFIKLMKTNYITHETHCNYEFFPHYNMKSQIFDNLFQKWENEYFCIEKNVKKKFSSSYYLNSYQISYRIFFRWLRNFKQVLYVYLPQIKWEVENSVIVELSKIKITQKIHYICRAMAYFVKLKSKNLRYTIHTSALKSQYKRMIDRFPFLFNYFNFCKNFIDLYKMLLEHYILIIHNTHEMKQTLYLMSCILTRLMDNQEIFLKSIQDMLILLENAK